mmetsp:Transcript_24117/g.55004  ORF Transcript_24117/g.55004 Transcript_24117/m.55004 type:complete len:247 (+) Transcript_24117:241-981(+)
MPDRVRAKLQRIQRLTRTAEVLLVALVAFLAGHGLRQTMEHGGRGVLIPWTRGLSGGVSALSRRCLKCCLLCTICWRWMVQWHISFADHWQICSPSHSRRKAKRREPSGRFMSCGASGRDASRAGQRTSLPRGCRVPHSLRCWRTDRAQFLRRLLFARCTLRLESLCTLLRVWIFVLATACKIVKSWWWMWAWKIIWKFQDCLIIYSVLGVANAVPMVVASAIPRTADLGALRRMALTTARRSSQH